MECIVNVFSRLTLPMSGVNDIFLVVYDFAK